MHFAVVRFKLKLKQICEFHGTAAKTSQEPHTYTTNNVCKIGKITFFRTLEIRKKKIQFFLCPKAKVYFKWHMNT